MERIARTADNQVRPILTVIQGYKVDDKEKVLADIAEALDGVQDMKTDERAKVLLDICDRNEKRSRRAGLHFFVTGVLAAGLLWCLFSTSHVH